MFTILLTETFAEIFKAEVQSPCSEFTLIVKVTMEVMQVVMKIERGHLKGNGLHE